MALHEATQGDPKPVKQPTLLDRISRIVGAGGPEPAQGRDQPCCPDRLVDPDELE